MGRITCIKHKKRYIAIIYFVMLGLIISGCFQQEKNKLSISNKNAKDSVIADSTLSDSSDNIEENEDEQFTFYPSGQDFIRSIIDKRGSVIITDEMRESFNLFARDFKLCYLPDMDGYESFFETTHYADSYGYPNFADAVFYVLQYMKCPQKMSAKAMQRAVESLFVDESRDDYASNYKEMPHQAYEKFAKYENGFYSPWSEGGLDHDRMFYLLTELDIVQDGNHMVYITISGKNYYFNDPDIYEAGEKETWLAKKSEEMEASHLQAAAKLIASGDMEELEGDSEFKTTIYIKISGCNPFGSDLCFVSNQSHGRN